MRHRVRKKAKNRLLTRAAQKRACVFAAFYRAATVRERFRNGVFQQPGQHAVLDRSQDLLLIDPSQARPREETRIQAAGDEVGVVQDLAVQRDRSINSLHHEHIQSAAHARDGFVAV
jgi:hypothetical protein